MKKRILFIDSNDAYIKNLIVNLLGLFDIQEVENYEDSFAVLSDKYYPVQAVMISILAFQKDNYMFISMLKENIHYSHIPVICFDTSYNERTSKAELFNGALEHGALGYVDMPFNERTVQLYISNLIDFKRSDFLADYDRFQVIIQKLNKGITIASEGYGKINFTYSNDLFYSMFGYTREQFHEELQDDVFLLVLPEDSKYVRSEIRTSLTRMESVQLQFRARKRDGTIIWIRIHNTVHYLGAAGQISLITFYEDVTGTLRTESRIRELNDKLANFEVFFQLELKGKKVIEYRSQYEPENNGRETDNVDYKQTLLAPIYSKEKKVMWEKLSFFGLMNSYQSGNTKFSLEYRRNMPNGEISWFVATAVLVEGVEAGTVNAFIFAHDIDIKMKSRIAKDKIIDTEVSDVTLTNISSGMSRNIKLYDSLVGTGGTTYFYDDNLRKHIEMEVAEEDRGRCRDFFALKKLVAAVEENGSASISFWIVLKKGNNVRKNVTVTYLDSTKRELLMVGRDITALFEKEAEQQMALKEAVRLADFANHAKSEFLSRMSHDMRTPLNGILGMNTLALEENKEPSIEKYLKNIEVSGNYLLGLINDTLDLSKIESGKMEFHFEPFSLDEFIMGINTVIKPLMDEKNIEFVMNLKRQISLIRVDKLRFNQIFYNLLTNAAKYTLPGGRVEFASEHIPDKDGKKGMRFYIRDNGIGMSREFQAKLFSPYSQEYGLAHKEQRGTGLGLAIVKQIVDIVGGAIKVESEIGKGTEFTVDLFAQQIMEFAEANEAHKDNADLLKGLNVLLVDDTEINTIVVSKMLEYRGCKVDVADNGKTAVSMFHNSEPGYYDIILTDIRMPVMDGFEEARCIRSLDRADAGRVPIIAATADAYNDIYEKIIEAGMNERLIKPINTDILCEAIVRLVKGNSICETHNYS